MLRTVEEPTVAGHEKNQTVALCCMINNVTDQAHSQKILGEVLDFGEFRLILGIFLRIFRFL